MGLTAKCHKCGASKWGNAVTDEEVCPVCDLGFPAKKVAGYEQMSHDVLIEERMREARAEEQERCARVCEKESKEHIADSVELEEKGLLNLANDAFDRAMTCGLLAAKIRGED